MPPVIRISDETFGMLQKIAKPLVDTPDSTIRRVLDAYLQGETSRTTNATTSGETGEWPIGLKPSGFDPEAPPDFTHATFISGQFGDVAVAKWNHLLIEAHAQAYKFLGKSLVSLQNISEAKITEGITSDKGFKPVKDFGFSIQGVEANRAWHISFGLAKSLLLPIAAEFRWQSKASQKYRDKSGCISWSPRIRKLAVHIGGSLLGPDYNLTQIGPNTFHYLAREGGERSVGEELVVSDSMIKKALGSLSRANIYNWHSEYINSGVMDGTTWSVSLEVSGKYIESHGSNAYPPKDQFDEFLKAMAFIVDGRALR